MRVQEHVKLSSAAAVIALPILKKDIWIPFAASIFIDVDHFIWHAVTQRTLSPRAAIRFFGQADPPQRRGAKFLHHPIVLGLLLVLALGLHSRLLLLILAGMLFHVSLDTIHVTQMERLRLSLSEEAHHTCPECGKAEEVLQIHTLRYPKNMLDRYHPRHFIVLCAACHKKAHTGTKSLATLL
jgi:hypothetical protein